MSIDIITEENNNKSNTKQLEFDIPFCIKPIKQNSLFPLKGDQA